MVILAGGLGTRVRHLLPDLPKPMAPVGGRPFLEWVVRFYARHGCRTFVLSTGYRADVIADHFRRQPVAGVSVTCRPEPEPLGTAGGFLHSLGPAGADPAAAWLVANGDSLVLADPRPLLAPLAAGRATAALLGRVLHDTARFGTLVLDAEDRLRAFREKQPGAGVVNTGVYALSAAAIRGMPARRPLSLETDVFPALAAAGTVAVVRTTADFLDIGTPDSLGAAARFIAEHQAHFLP